MKLALFPGGHVLCCGGRETCPSGHALETTSKFYSKHFSLQRIVSEKIALHMGHSVYKYKDEIASISFAC